MFALLVWVALKAVELVFHGLFKNIQMQGTRNPEE
jgi:hypothetical protein